MVLKYILGIFFLVFIQSSQSELIYEWDKIQVEPSPFENWRPTSFAVTKDHIFLTLVDVNRGPKQLPPGNGFLGWLNKTHDKSPKLKAYPAQSLYKRANPNGKIWTPMAVRTDNCNRLWLLDAAVRNINGSQVKENPSIFIFDLRTGKLILNYPFPGDLGPHSQWSSESFYVNFITDTEKSEKGCGKTFAYFADFNRNRLITYDFQRNQSFIQQHNFFNPDPLITSIPDEFIFNADQRHVNGIYGLALVKNFHEKPDRLFFHPLASHNEFSVETEKLNSLKDHPLAYKDVTVYQNKGDNAEAGFSVYDEHSEALFFAEVQTRKIGCLNLNSLKSYGQVIKDNYVRLDAHIPHGYIIDLNILDSDLWILVRHKSKISVYKENIADLVKGTSCVSTKSAGYLNSPFNLLVLFAIFNSLMSSLK